MFARERPPKTEGGQAGVHIPRGLQWYKRNGMLWLAPYDFATINNVLPLWNAGITGTGDTIAIVSDSDINPADLTNFRSLFGLPAVTFSGLIRPVPVLQIPGVQACKRCPGQQQWR